MSSVSPARAAAFDILLRVERESSYASELLHSSSHERLSTPDHALATQLVLGVLRWRSLLDNEISSAASQPLKKLDIEILLALRLAVFQFQWLDRIPQRAALNESVELVKRARKRSAAPFVNAVLRKIAQRTQPVPNPPDDASSADDLASDCAHPLWLVERWVKEYGFTAAEQVCRFDQSIPITTIRLARAERRRSGSRRGMRIVPGALLSSARHIETGDVTKTAAFRDRQIVIQDEASQLVAAITANAVGKNDRILDCCAAPGGKTLAMADQNPAAIITAIEAHPHRARLMKELLPALKTAASTPIQIVAADARHLPLSHAFNRVLADVPCSGTGTLARNPEIKWRLRPEDLADLHQRQVAILQSAMTQVAPGGRLIYSTCSLEREENEDVVQEALDQNGAFHAMDVKEELERLKAEGKLTLPDVKSLTRGPICEPSPAFIRATASSQRFLREPNVVPRAGSPVCFGRDGLKRQMEIDHRQIPAAKRRQSAAHDASRGSKAEFYASRGAAKEEFSRGTPQSH